MIIKDKILILGGNGLIGNELVAQLNSNANKIIVVDIKKTYRLHQSRKNFSYLQTDILEKNSILNIIKKTKPQIIINCINIATIYSRKPKIGYPKIIDFYLDLYRGLNNLNHKIHYIQIGTTGSGGLGFNIPFTHGENIENLPIINKAAFAGITTAMLTLLSRSFTNGTRISEIKPGLAIFEDKIIHTLFKKSRLILINGGESGYYTYNELALLTLFMGFTTSKRIAEKIIDIMNNKKNKEMILSNYDLIEKMNQVIISQDKIDLDKKNEILQKMYRGIEENYIIATGNLGPSTLTRDLILAFLKIKQPNISTANDFYNILKKDVAIQDTFSYIKTKNNKLSKYLNRECNYGNYVSISIFYKNDRNPWEIVYSKLKS